MLRDDVDYTCEVVLKTAQETGWNRIPREINFLGLRENLFHKNTPEFVWNRWGEMKGKWKGITFSSPVSIAQYCNYDTDNPARFLLFNSSLNHNQQT